MYLISLPHSPYAARLRMQILAKGLDIDIRKPESSPAGDAFSRLNPLAKIPVLVLDDGRTISESAAIAEYIEDEFDGTPCLPRTPFDKASVRTTVSMANTHIAPALFALFKQAGKPLSSEDSAILWQPLELLLSRWQSWRISRGESTTPWHTGDFAMATNAWYIETLALKFNRPSPLMFHAELHKWWQACQASSSIAPVLEEMQAGFAAFTKK